MNGSAIRFVLAAASMFAAEAAAQTPKSISGTDFVADFREMKGEDVTVFDCHIGGTTSAFIRCETPNGAASYSLDAASMNREDLKLAYTRCPTGSRSKPECRFSVTGKVKRGGMPEIEGAKLGPYQPVKSR